MPVRVTAQALSFRHVFAIGREVSGLLILQGPLAILPVLAALLDGETEEGEALRAHNLGATISNDGDNLVHRTYSQGQTSRRSHTRNMIVEIQVAVPRAAVTAVS